MKQSKTLIVIVISAIMLSSMVLLTTTAQTPPPVTCDSCGMTLDSTGVARYDVVDPSDHHYHACCPMCAFKLIKTSGGEANITTFCDYYGPSYPITINAKLNGSKVIISPQSAIIIAGGGCSKNRLVFNSTAADALLAPPNNGSSRWLSPMQNASVAANATRTSLAQQVLQTAGGTPSTCEACGMTMDISMQGRCKIFDATDTNHLACCPICAFKLLKNYGNLNITTFCDYYGTSYPIVITSRNNGTDTSVNPPDSLVILGGGCTKNRLVYNATAADLLLAPPNNGTSRWLPAMSNNTVASNATRMRVSQAAAQYGGGVTPSPSPSPTHSPEESTNPSTTGVLQQCETCDMDVTPESQARYRVTDDNGNVHYVECFMCTLQVLNDYETAHISTYCDWYGPNYPIEIDSTNFGQTVTVTPSTAMFLRGGSCVTARAAYNQTAADNLLANGYSPYTSPEQLYALPSNTQVKLVTSAIQEWYAQPITTDNPTSLVLVLVAVAGIIVVVGALLAYRKLRRP